jgi:hypothetical protein
MAEKFLSVGEQSSERGESRNKLLHNKVEGERTTVEEERKEGKKVALMWSVEQINLMS